MTLEEKRTIITEAVRALDINAESIDITPDEDTIGNVSINGEFFGVFDYIKRTFVA